MTTHEDRQQRAQVHADDNMVSLTIRGGNVGEARGLLAEARLVMACVQPGLAPAELRRRADAADEWAEVLLAAYEATRAFADRLSREANAADGGPKVRTLADLRATLAKKEPAALAE